VHVTGSGEVYVVLCRAVLQTSPHILVFWRPEISKFRAFLVDEAKPGKRTSSSIALWKAVAPAALAPTASSCEVALTYPTRTHFI
jgi:hypothetical protein